MSFKGMLLRYWVIYTAVWFGTHALLYVLDTTGNNHVHTAMLTGSVLLILYWYCWRNKSYLSKHEMISFILFAFLLDSTYTTFSVFLYAYSIDASLDISESFLRYFTYSGFLNLISICVFVLSSKSVFKRMGIINDQIA
jgi:hypothetical protein